MKMLGASPAWDLGGNARISNMLDPSSAQDAATKHYVDTQVGVTPAALTKTDDTNVTLALGGTPATALLQATSLTLGWTGTLAISRGGTGASSVTSNQWFGNSSASPAAPAFNSLAALTEVDDTNVTLTLGGTPGTALAKAVSLTLGWTGFLSQARGGFGASIISVAAGSIYCNPTGLAGAPSFSTAPRITTIANLTSNGFIKTGGGTGNLSVDTTAYLSSVVGTSPINSSVLGATATVSLDNTVDLALTAGQTVKVTDSVTGITNVLQLSHNTTGTPAINSLGPGLLFSGEDDTSSDQTMGQIYCMWSTITHASRTAYMDLRTPASGLLSTVLRLWGSNGASLNNTTDPGAGFFNVPAAGGYKINNVNILPISTTNGGLPTGGTVGQALRKTSSTNYATAWNDPAFVQASQTAATAGTTSTTGIMAGLPGSINPNFSGRVLITVCGYLTSSVAGAFAAVISIRYGTGTAPVHGAAPTGTVATGGNAYGHSASANYTIPFCVTAIATGLTVGTTYWLDVQYGSSSVSSTAKLNVAAINAFEF